MSESKDDVDSLLSIRADADYFLKVLDDVEEEAQPSSDQPQSPQSDPLVSSHHDSAFHDEQEIENPLPGLLIIGILLVVSLFVWLSQSKTQEPVSTLPPLGYSSSCGSLPGTGKRWWPVLGRANRQFLQTIRNRYCGDAYINEEGALQVASFDSWNGAESFRLRLEAATGSSFRVGQGR